MASSIKTAIIPVVFVAVWLIAAVSAAAAVTTPGGDNDQADVITTDVCIVGGGSSGIYAAVNLRAAGKNVIVLERSNRIGGHTQTYTDLATGTPINIGVLVFENNDVVKNYFSLLNVPLKISEARFQFGNTSYVDFRTGTPILGFTTNATALSEALAAYGAQIARFPYFDVGYNLPDPVPEDLLLSVDQFFQKYSLQLALPSIFAYNQGFGDILSQPVLYTIAGFGLELLRSIQLGFLVPVSGDNYELYSNALTYLGNSVLLNSNILQVTRSDTCVEVEVETPSGRKVVNAKKLIIAIPPKLYNLEPFDLSSEERSLFSQFINTGYYTGLLSNTGIPDGVTVVNIGIDTPYNLPAIPGLYGLTPSGAPGLIDIKYSADEDIPDDEVKRDIVATVERLRNAGLNTQTPNFAIFKNHNPFELRVPVQAVRRGFYRRLNGLQGQRSTFYTGAAWQSHDSGRIWEFTNALLPQIIASR